MQVKDIMSRDPACCTPDAKLSEVARLMVEHDCGEIPIVESRVNRTPVGVITDRDITCRVIAVGKNPLQIAVRDCMSSPVVTVTPEIDVKECCEILERRQIRRVPVVDERGHCCGIVSQADIATNAPERDIGEVVRGISQPTGISSRTRSL